ncbi:Tn3 family transposase [Paraburkholderia sp. UYCP14C]|uniref:Tn3 family transposase n=1 Tax=Paraburkholderia sp. UYCP14C TaxID=2511130 RepID=UPI00101F08B1|nr:Tn3 family transposase [Paraburkholderia sp. UYCP14C]RZF24084.1 Tn3 family transposase [Paraburkholderia sp. UYCP14C]
MPRRELLTPAQRFQLFAFPEDEGELIRLATLSAEDFAFVRQHRSGHNRLGIAVLMIYLRYPGRVLGPAEKPHAPIVGIVAAQLGVTPAVWDLYAARDETRREHLQELLARLGLAQFGRQHYRALVELLMPVAMQTTQGIALAQAAVDELRRRHVLLPPVAALEKLCAAVATRAQRDVYRLLTAPLTTGQRTALDQLLLPLTGRPVSKLAWLRQSPGEPSAKAVLAHIERLQAIRALDLPPDIGRNVHQNRLLRLAREGGQTAVYQIEEYETDRRHATLIAILLDTTATLTDEILNLHDRLIGSFFTKAKHKYEKRFAAEGKAVNDKVRLYAKVGAALIAAKDAGDDPFRAIEAVMPWETFTASVRDAEQLARDAEFDSTALLVNHYSQLRRYSPTFLDTFDFRAAPARQDLMDAITQLRELNRTEARKVPADAPTGFVKQRWARFVFKDGGIDRKFYEMAAMSELKNALRSGDVSVIGSRQFKDFDEYLMRRPAFDEQRRQRRLGLAVETSAASYLDERIERLREALDETARLATAGELPDVELNDKGLRITPLDDATPAEAEMLTQQAYDLMPRVKITDLLLEVDQWTDFTRHFTHLKSEAEPPDRTLLLTAILADAFNLGLEKMADACPGTSAAKLSWLVAWYIRDETFQKGLAELVNYQHGLPFAAYWGEGTTSSSDGQRFRAGGHGLTGGYRNAKYGNEPGVLFYTHISDQYAPFHTKVINSPVRDATHVLDGLLYHESELRIEEHYTDTAGFTDHVFALCHFLGFEFAPRIADLADKNLYVPGKPGDWPALSSLVGGSISRKLIEREFDDVVRLAASIQQGTVTASLILRKLSAYPRQNGLAVGLRELGRIERTLFTLKWLQDPALRRRVSAGLNKGEARNSLARAVFFYRLGEVRDRSYENQRYRASGLNLVVAAITLWNTVYLERSIAALRQQSEIDDSLISHVAPLGWNHINLTGDYVWHANKRVAKGRFRPLRVRKSTGPP